MSAFYNEIDPYAAQWLRNLIDAGHIAPGVVDERSIADLRADDLAGFTQCHFFAGIGVWSRAMRLAGWDDARPVWTGSCPCQPFSAAGKGAGLDDARHLWPAWHRLISECRPAVVFGEQVASSDGVDWLALVHADMESSGFAFGAADLPAAGVGAPHIRQRLFFVAHAGSGSLRGRNKHREHAGAAGAVSGEAREQRVWLDGGADGGACLVGNASDARLALSERDRGVPGGPSRADTRQASERAGVHAFWSAAEWIPCRDGKARPVEPGTFPLAHGAPARVGRLRAYGNAIVPQVAAAFIEAAEGAMT